MNKLGSIKDSSINSGKSGLSQASKSTKKGITDFGEEAIGQLTDSRSDQGTNEQQSASAKTSQMSDEDAKEFLQNMYGPKNSSNTSSSKKDPKSKPANTKEVLGIPSFEKPLSPEEAAKKEKIEKELHNEYFQKTFNPPKVDEDKIREKSEEQEEEVKKMEDLEKKEKEKQEKIDLGAAVKQGTAEIKGGIGG